MARAIALGNVGERGEGACLSGLGLNYPCPVGAGNGADWRRLLRRCLTIGVARGGFGRGDLGHDD